MPNNSQSDMGRALDEFIRRHSAEFLPVAP